MISTAVTRGLAAGLVAGVLAGLFALVLAEPSIDAAIALEEAAAGASQAEAPHADAGARTEPGISRTTQKIGLVVATSLYGIGVGALFGVAAAWARGRLAGDTWTRSLKLGAAAAGALVVLPALKYPPNPPAVGDPATIGGRTSLYLVTCVIGLALAGAAWAAGRRLGARQWRRPAIHATVAAGGVVSVAVALALLPDAQGVGGFPADLLWTFRLSALGTQLVLLLGIAVVYGALAVRGEQPSPERLAAPA